MAAELQWGRDVSAAEMFAEDASVSEVAVASMGPRRFRRGNHNENPGKKQVVVASMGPRRFRRGNGEFMRDSAYNLDVLQWGRDVSAAEIQPFCAASSAARICFNGAATFPPRK